MTQDNRTAFQDVPTELGQLFSKTVSCETVKSDGISMNRQTSHDESANSLSTLKRNLTTPPIKKQSSQNGVSINGASTTRNTIKKSPLLPPKHNRHQKSVSSDSSIASNNSSGSISRLAESTVTSSNWDDQLQDCPSSSGSLEEKSLSRPDASPEPKRPLLPPSMKSFATDDRPITKPLPPSPPRASQLPGNSTRNVIAEEEMDESRDEVRVVDDESELNLGQSVSKQDGQQKDELKSENESLKQQILRLRQENQLLRQNTRGPSSSPNHSSRSNTSTPIGRSSSRGINCVSPNELTVFSDSDSNNPSPSSLTVSPSVNNEQQGRSNDAKQVARQQISRIIEQAQVSSSDMVDHKTLSEPVTKSVAQSSLPDADSTKSPNVSITSPLSPLSPATSTPSPTALVTFGLASQTKRREIKRSHARKEKNRQASFEENLDDTQKTAVLVPCQQLPDSQSPDSETQTESSITTSEKKPLQPPKPGKFAGKHNKSIVSSTAKLFQGASIDSEVKTSHEKCSNASQQAKSPDDESEREKKESFSSESDEVFTESSQQVPSLEEPFQKRLQCLHRDTQSESQIWPSGSNGEKSGVAFKRTQLKSDLSWIKSKTSTANHEQSTNNNIVRSESPLSAPSPPLRPFRSHQILNTASPPPPSLIPTQSVKPKPTPQTFESSSHPPQTGITFSSKPVDQSKGNRVHGLVNTHTAETEKEGRTRTKKGSKSKHRENERDCESRMSRSVSDESLQGTSSYSSQRVEAKVPNKPPRPAPMTRNQSTERVNGRPSSVLIAGGAPPRAWVDGVREADFTVSCTVPSGLPVAGDKSPKRKFKKSTDANPLAKKGSIFGRLKKTRDKDQPRIPAPALEEEEYETDSSSEDEKGATIKYKPKLRPVSVRRPSHVEDDYDLSYDQLFERVFVVGLKQDPTSKKLVTEVTYTFPPRPIAETSRDETMESIPQFCFPDIHTMKPTTKFKSETFSFVLTNMEGHRRFGYCRRLLPSGRGARLPEVTCLVSPLGCFSLYEKILDHIEARRQVSTTAVFTFLKAIVANPFPKPGRTVQVRSISAKGGEMETVTLKRPLDSRLEHVDFSLLFATLSPRKIIQLFSSMLMERRIILCSSNLSLLTGCAHALLALLYPFEWQHVFIPILPNALIDFCCSPMPYLMGMNPSLIPALDEMETMEEALVVDLDKKKFVKKIGDEVSILPSKLFQYLEHRLSSAITGEYQKSASKRSNPCRADEIVTNTFMIFFVYLYGDYKQYMQTKADGALEFQKKDYEQKFSSKSIRRFLEAFHMTQMFENFAEQRENPLKSATTAQSTFERQNINEMRERCVEIEIFSSKSKISRWRLRKRI